MMMTTWSSTSLNARVEITMTVSFRVLPMYLYPRD
jgi:hypothetical protein